MIPAEIIELVREYANIVEVVSEHVQLRRSGAHFVGRCPFHADGTPSLYVRPDKRVFRCHACQAGGDVFRFVQLLHHCSFRQSVECLAARAGIRIDAKPSPELTAKVAALKAQREEAMQLQHFVDERIAAVNRQYRSLARAATNAEDYLRAGLPADAHIDDLAWSALERFRVFEARIEREGLCDVDILRAEWEQMREVA